MLSRRPPAIALALVLALACAAQAQTRRPPYGLPAGALVVETRTLELGGAKGRALVLWMLRPKKEPFWGGDEDQYTCPDETRGSFYTGPTRVSLVDTASRRVINTVRVIQEYMDGADSFDVPYSIRRGGYYHVEGVAEGRAGRPQVMRLGDYNGDGEALEFALFDALACMGLQTALFGYSRTRDRVVQYPIHVEVSDGKTKSREVRFWMDYLFAREPDASGRRRYEVDYRGRGGSLDIHDIRYHARLERFEGAVTHLGGGEP